MLFKTLLSLSLLSSLNIIAISNSPLAEVHQPIDYTDISNIKLIAKKPYTGIVKTVDDIAEQITVRIAVADNPTHGSGVILAKQGKTYYVATAWHVVENQNEYKIVTSDGESHPLVYGTVARIKGYDAAIFSFTSERNYQVAKIGNYAIGRFREQVVFVSGFPELVGSNRRPQRLITGGRVALQSSKRFTAKDSLSLEGNGEGIIYTNISYRGMSGGALLDSQGNLVGINTGTEGEIFIDEEGNYDDLKLGFSLGVSMQSILGFLAANNLALQPQWLYVAQNSPPALSYNFNEYNEWQIVESQLLTATEPNKNADIVAWMNYGNQLWRYGRHTEAIAAFTRVIELDPNFDKAYYAMGLAYSYQGEHQQAVRALEKATQINDSLYYYWRRLGLAYSQLEQYDRAIAAYDRAIEENKKSKKDFILYFGRGKLSAEVNRHAEAIAFYDEAMRIDPDFVSTYDNRGRSYLELQQYEKAFVDFNEAILLNPNNYDAYFYRGIAYTDMQQYEKALADFTKAWSLNPLLADALYNRGVVYRLLKQYDYALEDFNTALAYGPNKFYEFKANIYVSRSLVYDDLGQYSKALADLSSAISLNANHAGAYTQRGTIYARRFKQYNRALEDFDKAIAINPEQVEAYNNRGYTHALMGNFDLAKQDVQEAARLYYKLGDMPAYQKALRLLQDIERWR